MHGIWVWSAAGFLVALALVAAAARSRTRQKRPTRPTRPTRPVPSPTRRRTTTPATTTATATATATATGHVPAPREIWWAEVPFEDGPGAKDRPCLVVRVNGRTATVVKITSKHHAERPGVLALPPGTVADRQGRPSWLETDELREVPLADFRRRVGPVDAQTWARAQRELR